MIILADCFTTLDIEHCIDKVSQDLRVEFDKSETFKIEEFVSEKVINSYSEN